MAHVVYERFNLATNSRAYELLQESKKDPEKIKVLKKHLEETKKKEKELLKHYEQSLGLKDLTPQQYLTCLGFKVKDSQLSEGFICDVRVDGEKLTDADKQRFNKALQVIAIRYPHLNLSSPSAS